MNRILSVTQARSLYLKRVTEAKGAHSSTRERHEANREVKRAVRALQQAQLTERLRKSRGRIPRPMDWNQEIS